MTDKLDKWNKSIQDSFDRDQRIHKQPVTKKEKEALEEARENPAFEYHLEPNGYTYKNVDEKVSAENERRINFINNRLNRMQGKLKNDFKMSR